MNYKVGWNLSPKAVSVMLNHQCGAYKSFVFNLSEHIVFLRGIVLGSNSYIDVLQLVLFCFCAAAQHRWCCTLTPLVLESSTSEKVILQKSERVKVCLFLEIKEGRARNFYPLKDFYSIS